MSPAAGGKGSRDRSPSSFTGSSDVMSAAQVALWEAAGTQTRGQAAGGDAAARSSRACRLQAVGS